MPLPTPVAASRRHRPRHRSLQQRRGIGHDAVLARARGHPHRCVAAADDLLGGLAGLGVRHADAQVHGEAAARDGDGQSGRLDHPLGQGARVGHVADAVEDDEELIAADAADDVIAPHEGPQAAGEGAQRLVAVRVVDLPDVFMSAYPTATRRLERGSWASMVASRVWALPPLSRSVSGSCSARRSDPARGPPGRR